MLRCAITGGHLPGKAGVQRIEGLLRQVGCWADEGVELILLRERHLAPEEHIGLADEILRLLERKRSAMRLLVHCGRGAAEDLAAFQVLAGRWAQSPERLGLHVSSAASKAELSALQALWPFFSVSCHSADEVERARDAGASVVFFAPVFGKSIGGELVVHGVGLEALRDACRVALPMGVLALGGVTWANAAACLAAGAAGIAGIRLFLEAPTAPSLQ
jgi:thiamine-phosphate pyrophosphorylase